MNRDIRVLRGDCVRAMRLMEPDSIDAIVTDPPYGLEFMGKEWDRLGDIRQPGDDNYTMSPIGPYSRAKVRHGSAESYGGSRAKLMQDWHRRWAEAAYRVLKPGGHMLVAGIGRTHHRMMCGVEDAGFEVRDCIYHVTGSGFPKSLDVSKAIDKAAGAEREVIGRVPKAYSDNPQSGSQDGGFSSGMFRGEGLQIVNITTPATDDARRWEGWGTALKPAVEVWALFRKPLSEKTVAANVLKWGTGAINVDGTRVEGPKGEGVWGASNATIDVDRKFNGSPDMHSYRSEQHPAGRWPPNLLLQHSPDCQRIGERRVKGPQGGNGGEDPGMWSGKKPIAIQRYADADGLEAMADWRCAEGCAVAELARQSGESKSSPDYRDEVSTTGNTGIYREGWQRKPNFANDTGTAARFFPQFGYEAADFWPFRYVAKASRAEREKGVGGKSIAIDIAGLNTPEQRAARGRNPKGIQPVRNDHPTVKAVALMRWLLTLVVPPGGLALDPFAGSGSTLVAAKQLGVRCVGIEQDAGYAEIARQRIAATQAVLA